MTDAQIKALHARVSERVNKQAETDIADIRAAIPFKIETEMVEIMNLEDEINSDERSLERVKEAIKQVLDAPCWKCGATREIK